MHAGLGRQCHTPRACAEFQETREQATKGILALTTRPSGGMAAQPDDTAAVGSGQEASGTKSVPKEGAGHRRSGNGGAGG